MADGFNWSSVNPTSTDRFRHFLNLYGAGRETFLGSLSIANGDTTNVVTGVGFAPEWVFIFDAVNDTYGQFIDGGDIGIGVAAGSDQWTGRTYAVDLSHTKETLWRDDRIADNGSELELASFDADGFTLTVHTSPAVSQLFTYICGRGEGNYAVGTDLSPATTGTQTIVCGFEPTAVFLGSTQQTSLGLITPNASIRMCMGGGDGTNQYSVWAGDGPSGDVYNNQATQQMALAFWEDAQISGPFQPVLQAEADLTNFSAGGGGTFDLDWNVIDGVQRYFSWWAVEGPAEVQRFIYNSTFPTEVFSQPTAGEPKGLIFWMNNMNLDGSQNEATSGSASIGVGACDPFFSQAVASWMAIDAPSFFIPRSVRDMEEGVAFGAYGQRAFQTATPNTPQDLGTIFSFGITEGWMPQIYRRVIQR